MKHDDLTRKRPVKLRLVGFSAPVKALHCLLVCTAARDTAFRVQFRQEVTSTCKQKSQDPTCIRQALAYIAQRGWRIIHMSVAMSAPMFLFVLFA